MLSAISIEQFATVAVATGRIADTTQINPSYLPGGGNVQPGKRLHGSLDPRKSVFLNSISISSSHGVTIFRRKKIIVVTPWFIRYTVRQKKGTNFLLCASILILDKTGDFLTYIKERIRYNSIYLTLACIKNFA